MIRLDILGPGIARTGEDEGLDLTGLPLALLAYLAVTGRPIERDELATLFWPGSDPSRRRHSLRQALSRIRSAVPDDVFEADGQTVSIDSMAVETDREEFLEALSSGRVADALALWRGILLEGFRREGAWELGEWLERERTRLRDALRSAVLERDEASDTSDLALLASAHGALPLEQRIVACYATALIRAGREAEALILVPLGADQDPRAGWEEILAAAEEAQAASVRQHVDSLSDADAAPRRRLSGLTAGLVTTLVLASATIGAVAILGHPPEPTPATLFFCSDRASDADGESHLFRMDEAGVDKHRVVSRAVCGARPIAEDRLLARSTGPDARRLRVLGPDTTNAIAEWGVLPTPELDTLVEVQAFDVSWGQTGVVVAFAARLPSDSTREVFRWLPDVGEVERLTNHEEEDDHVRIAPDGSIVFRSVRSGDPDIWVWSESEGARPLVTSPAWERDPILRGDTLLFLRGRGVGDEDGNIDIWLRDLSTGHETRLTDNAWNDYNVRWSPDGRYLCWQSEEFGHYEMDVVVQDLETGDRWTVAGGPGRQSECRWDPGSVGVYYSDWQPEGPELFFTPLGAETRNNLSRYPGKDGGLEVVPEIRFTPDSRR